MRNFEAWFSQFRDSISGYGYYINFEKVVANAERCRSELHLLNALIGTTDIEERFREMLVRFPSVIGAIPILLAVREREI